MEFSIDTYPIGSEKHLNVDKKCAECKLKVLRKNVI